MSNSNFISLVEKNPHKSGKIHKLEKLKRKHRAHMYKQNTVTQDGNKTKSYVITIVLVVKTTAMVKENRRSICF